MGLKFLQEQEVIVHGRSDPVNCFLSVQGQAGISFDYSYKNEMAAPQVRPIYCRTVTDLRLCKMGVCVFVV